MRVMIKLILLISNTDVVHMDWLRTASLSQARRLRIGIRKAETTKEAA
jgi:hypothetical protein